MTKQDGGAPCDWTAAVKFSKLRETSRQDTILVGSVGLPPNFTARAAPETPVPLGLFPNSGALCAFVILVPGLRANGTSSAPGFVAPHFMLLCPGP